MATGTDERTGSAEALLRRAHDAMHRWPGTFPGFTAPLRLACDGEAAHGRVTSRPGAAPVIDLGAPHPLAGRAHDELAPLVGHRRPRRFEDADGRHVLHLGPEDGHPLGRLVRVDDGIGSSHRVAPDGTIGEIRRSPGGATFAITILDRTRSSDGGWLSRGFTVAHWDDDGRRIRRVDVYRDDHVEVCGAAPPRSRRVLVATDTGVELRAIVLEGHAPLGAGEEA